LESNSKKNRMKNKEKLKRKQSRCFKSFLVSTAIAFLGGGIMGVGGYFMKEVPKPEIYQTLLTKQGIFYNLNQASNDLKTIPANNLENTIQELEKVKLSVKKDMEEMEETPELKEYHEKIMSYNPQIIFGGSVGLLGLTGALSSAFLYERYKRKLDSIPK